MRLYAERLAVWRTHRDLGVDPLQWLIIWIRLSLIG